MQPSAQSQDTFLNVPLLELSHKHLIASRPAIGCRRMYILSVEDMGNMEREELLLREVMRDCYFIFTGIYSSYNFQ